MPAHRSDRVVKVLTAIASVAWYGLWIGAAVALILLPIGKLMVGDDPDWTVTLARVGVTLPDTTWNPETTVPTSWGPAQVTLDDIRANVDVPLGAIPWWVVAVVWTYAAACFGLMLLAVHHLRRIFQRVRDGAPFDEQNALRLRSLGLLILALTLFTGVAEACTSLIVHRWLAKTTFATSAGLQIEMPGIFVALVLIALAEIFRRGAELEHEQSLVI